MLDQRKVGAVDQMLLLPLPAVEGHLFGVFNETRVREAVFTLELLLRRGVLAERRRELLEQHRSETDDGRGED